MRARALLCLTSVLAILTATAACTGSKGDGIDARCDLEESRYQGDATDETCVVLLDAEGNQSVQVGGPNVSAFTVPTSGQAFSSSATTITFRWTSPIDADGDASLVPHEPPITGAVHMIRIKGAGEGDPPELLYFTTLLHLDVTGAPLAQVKEASGPLSVEITSVYVTQNRILTPASDGPFRPADDTSFSVTP